MELGNSAIRSGSYLASWAVVYFLGSVNIWFTHACTIRNSVPDIVFKTSCWHTTHVRTCCLFWSYTVFDTLCIFLTGECIAQSFLRTTTVVLWISFEFVHKLQRRHCSFVVPEVCENPAPLKEAISAGLLCSAVSCEMLVLQNAQTVYFWIVWPFPPPDTIDSHILCITQIHRAGKLCASCFKRWHPKKSQRGLEGMCQKIITSTTRTDGFSRVMIV